MIGSGRDGGQDVARRNLGALHGDAIGPIHAERVDRLELVDEVGAERVLEGGASRLDPARHEQHLLVLDVDAFDRTDAIRERERLRRAEGLGGVPGAIGPHDRRIEALLDGGPDAEDRREGEAGDLEVTAVANVDLVDLVERMLGGVGGEDVGQARVHPHTDEGELATRVPGVGHCELLIAELQAGLAEGPLRMRLREAHRHVHVVDVRLSAPVKIGITNCGSTAFMTRSTR